MNKTLISTKNLQKYFPVRSAQPFTFKKEYVKANKNITLDIQEGETLGIVGESGCGKSTFGRTLIQLQTQTGGASMYYGETLEDYMPDYVKKVIQTLPKTIQNYDRDNAELKRLKALIKPLRETPEKREELDALLETYRLLKIEFENTYYNMFRIVGGLLAHPDLKAVQSVMMDWYYAFKKRAKILKKVRQEEIKIVLNAAHSHSRLDTLKKELDVLEAQIKTTEDAKKALEDVAKKDERFAQYESFKDEGIDLSNLSKAESRYLKKDLQIIFQDPFSSLDPRSKVGDIIGEGLLIHGIFESKKDPAYQQAILDVMEKCGLDASYINRYPHQFSGGQRQRIGIARALVLNPKFIVADEAVSALDVSIQSQIINLLQELKSRLNLTYLFITHDLGVVRYISDRIGVMYFGRLVELASAKEIFDHPSHPYTKQLLNAIPQLEDDENKLPEWPITFETDTLEFRYADDDDADHDWVEVRPGHFVLATLKDPDLNLEGGIA